MFFLLFRCGENGKHCLANSQNQVSYCPVGKTGSGSFQSKGELQFKLQPAVVEKKTTGFSVSEEAAVVSS